MSVSMYTYAGEIDLATDLFTPYTSSQIIPQPAVEANLEFLRFFGKFPVYLLSSSNYSSPYYTPWESLYDTSWGLQWGPGRGGIPYPFDLRAQLLGPTDHCRMSPRPEPDAPFDASLHDLVPPQYYFLHGEHWAKHQLRISDQFKEKLNQPAQVVSWEVNGELDENASFDSWLAGGFPMVFRPDPDSEDTTPSAMSFTDWLREFVGYKISPNTTPDEIGGFEVEALRYPGPYSLGTAEYPVGGLQFLVLDSAFWHHRGSNAYVEHTGDTNTNWLTILPEEQYPESLGCLPQYPDLIGKVSTMKLTGVPISREVIVDTRIEILEGARSPNRIQSGMIGGSIFTGGYYSDHPPVVSAASGPSATSNTNKSRSETETEILVPAVFAEFQVRAYCFNPGYTAINDKWNASDLTHPILSIQRIAGNTRITSAAKDKKEYAAVWKQAEELAKSTYLSQFPWTPHNMWSPKVENPMDWVEITYADYRTLPGWAFWRDRASLEMRQNLQNYDYVMAPAFRIQVTQDAVTRTISKDTNEITESETIESVHSKDPEAFPPTVITTETYHTRLTAELKWILEPGVRCWRRTDEEQPNGTYERAARCYHMLLEKSSIEPLSTRAPAGFISKATVSADPNAIPPPNWEEEVEYFRYMYPLGSYPGDDEAQFQISELSFEQSEQLNSWLFRSEKSILDYLPAVQYPKAEAKAAIARWDAALPGTTYLSQRGAPAPVYPSFHDALVWDLHLQKWGRMRQEHQVLFDLTPINAHRKRVVESSVFEVRAGLLSSAGQCYTFNEKPYDSELRYGKLGYHRLGFTHVEELRVHFVKPANAEIQLEPSLDGHVVEAGWVTSQQVNDAAYAVALQNTSARWYNVTIKGHFDLKAIEFVGWKSSRR